ncbi:MAG: amino acid ABC transporter ATP-binding protein [Chloroflexi bacterium]|nr:amino acid ABC transporter ATP-binding protein [Chloroflexota bacterium]
MVLAEDVQKSFGANRILKGVDLTVAAGEVVVLMGPSGSGKSTFLRCLNRLTDPDGGRIVVAGSVMTDPATNLPKARRRIGFVSQHFHLYPHMTVLANVMEGPRTVLRVPRQVARERGRDLLARVGLSDKEAAMPWQLSGGQQQRVAIARALAMEPTVMLFDEPTSALDPELTGEVLDTMQQLALDGLTMLIVSHEIHFASRVADRLAMFDAGCVIEEGPPERLLRSASQERTGRFLARLMSWESDLAATSR